MKKNIFRILSLVLVAAMLFAVTACSQEIKVRLVDANGNDIDVNALKQAAQKQQTYQIVNNGGSQQPANNNPQPANNDPQPAGDPDAEPVNDPDAEPADKTNKVGPAVDPEKVPATKEEILDFYKAAVAYVKDTGAPAYNKQEWQDLGDINIIGISALDNAVRDVAYNYATTKDKAELQVCAKKSDDSARLFPHFVLTDYSKVQDAKIDASGENYKITIVLQDEDTPKSTGSFVEQSTNSVLLWDTGIAPELANISLIQGYDDVHVYYRAFTINAEITRDGKFVYMTHVAHVDITIGSLSVGLNKMLKATVKNKSGQLINTCEYTGFKY